MKILVSACIMGVDCKYNGKNNKNLAAINYLKDKEIICICPEQLAGMATPRPCAEIVNGVVTDENGNDVDLEYKRAVSMALSQIQHEDIELAILQSRSPADYRRTGTGSPKGNPHYRRQPAGLVHWRLFRPGGKTAGTAGGFNQSRQRGRTELPCCPASKAGRRGAGGAERRHAVPGKNADHWAVFGLRRKHRLFCLNQRQGQPQSGGILPE